MADLIVLAGNVGVENSAKTAGHSVSIPFSAKHMMRHKIILMLIPSQFWNQKQMALEII